MHEITFNFNKKDEILILRTRQNGVISGVKIRTY